MRRFERRRLEHWRRRAVTIGFAFAAGALVNAGLTARLSWQADSAGPETQVAENAALQSDEHPGALGTTGIVSEGEAAAVLEDRLVMPVEGVAADSLYDSYDDARSGGRRH